jgi:hypothetical protein
VNYPNILINNSPLDFVENFDYLGIIVDKNLTWKAHLLKICSKMSKVSGIMCKMKNILSQDILRTLYNSLFLPYINYGILCWKSKIKEVVKLQKKVVRIIEGANYNAHTEPIFKKHRLLKVFDICTLQELKFCYKMENNLLPPYFLSGLFTRNSSIHHHRTRVADSFHLPRVRHEFAKMSIQYIIPQAYNNCPIQIKSKIHTHSYPGFIRYIKHFFISNYVESCSIRNCYICQS